MRAGLAARLSLLNAAVFMLASTAVIAVVVLLAGRYVDAHIEESVIAELDALVADYTLDGRGGVVGFIAIREQLVTPHHARVYRLEDATGAPLAGRWAQWPAQLATDGRLLRVPNTERRPESEWWMAAATLPDGSRVLVGFDSIERRALMGDIYRAAGLGLALAFAAALLLGALVNRAALAPIATIRRSAEKIIEGDLAHRIPDRAGSDEFAALTSTLNRMLDRIEQLIAGVRAASDAIAHDLRSPLSRHRARLEQALLETPDGDERAEWLQAAIADVDQVLSTFNALLQLATVEAGVVRTAFADLSFAQLVEDAVSLYEAQAAERGMPLVLDLQLRPCLLRGDRQLLFQAVVNLLDNALKYGPRGQTVTITLRREGRRAVLEVQDQGPGVDEPERAFQRLVRGDAARQTPGHGLGLTLVRATAQLHGGSAELRSDAAGTCARLCLPLPAPDAVAERRRAA